MVSIINDCMDATRQGVSLGNSSIVTSEWRSSLTSLQSPMRIFNCRSELAKPLDYATIGEVDSRVFNRIAT